MSEVTLILNETQYTIDRELIIKHSQFLKDLLELFPDKKEYDIPFPIKSLNNFVDYMNDKPISLEYDDFIVHKFLDTKDYFDHLIYLLVKEGIDIDKIDSLDSDLSWEIYDHLPLNLIPEEMLTEGFIERYRKKRLPNYPGNVLITRNKEEIETEVLISGDYCRDGRYGSWYPNGQLKEQSNWSKGKEDGRYQTWYENGQKYEDSNWLEGKKHGLYQTWYPNGQMEEASNWLEDQEHGLREIWHENGKKREESNWLKGNKHGLYQTWYGNGQKYEESDWLEGERLGLCQAWHPDGQESKWFKW